jgi:hypothetical protein
MLKARINILIDLIPLESNIYTDPKQKVRGTTFSDLIIHRRAHALLDPAFSWNYVQAFAHLNQPLPAVVYEPYIKLAYGHTMNRAIDEDITEAQIIQHPRWVTKRGFLEALLILPSLRLDQVAQYVGLPISVVQVYENLFWSVRDRLEDQLFMNAICYPDTRQVEYRADYWNTENPRNLMLRAAFHNDLDAVLQIFGSRTKREEQSSEVSTKRLKTRFLTDADFVVRAGGSGSKVPVLDAARKLIVEAEKNYRGPQQEFGDDIIGLCAIGLNPGQSVLETIKGLTDNTTYDQQVSLQALSDPRKN